MNSRFLALTLFALAGCGPKTDAPAAVPRDAPPTPAVPTAAPPKPAPAAPIQTSRLAAAVTAKQSKSLKVSVGVYDAATGDSLYEANGNVARRPASCMKVATTAAAVLALGTDGELATEVAATARPDADGRVAGDLVVRGGGDPGFNNREGLGRGNVPGQAEAALREMAKAVRAKGVRSVTGDLILDDSAFSGAMRHPGWNWSDGQWQWFMAPVSSLLVTDACVEFTVLPGSAPGAAATLRLDPPTQVVRFVNKVATAAASSKKTNVVVGRTDASGSIPVTGDVPAGSAGYRLEAACVDPVEHFGDVFLRVLREEGVEVGGKAVVRRGVAVSHDVSSDPATLVALARHATPLLDVVRVANKHSQNLYAELLLRAVSHAAGGDGSFADGCTAARRALGFATGDPTFTQVDGSGLARENQVTVGALGKILVKMYGSPAARDFIGSLPGAAEPESTLRKRFGAAKYDGRVYAKTGTLRDTSSLAGYVRTVAGRTLVFVVLCEGEVGRARELQDDVVAALIEQ
jgi:D-alanyl-D-alanine carboxypeptidase/D-alanyl-D-alanine-endopeptidase (penicillin-binding protein 4)